METDMSKIITSEYHYTISLSSEVKKRMSQEEYRKLRNQFLRTFKSTYKTKANAEAAVRMSRFDAKDVCIGKGFYMGFGL